MSNTNKATLSPEDRKTFFRLFIPLLDFTNQKYEINAYLSEDMRRGHPDMQDLKEVAAVLWANPETIDEYIEAAEKQFGLEEQDRRLLESWRLPVSGRFILERHLSKGSVFIGCGTKHAVVYDEYNKSIISNNRFSLICLIKNTCLKNESEPERKIL